MSHLKILFASSEVTPFAKTGGLADVSGSLPTALASLGHEVVVVMPLYKAVKEGNFDLIQFENPLEVPFRGEILNHRFFIKNQSKNLIVCFIQNDELYDRSELYGTPEGDYSDNADRFIFFSRGLLHLTKLLDFQPDIIHCNDWQTGLVPVYLKSLYTDDPFFRNSRTIYTIHNLAYQGIFPQDYMDVTELPPEIYSMEGIEYYGKVNFMKGGIVFSDAITTVSAKYAQEIKTPEFGYGLDGVLRERTADVHGILNGVDYTQWNPETDPHIAANYSLEDLSGKRKCKQELREIFQLEGSEDIPIIGMISRLADQKGFDLLVDALDELLRKDLFLVILGKGDRKYENQFTRIEKEYKGRIGVRIAFDNTLAHKIEAGSDMFLMPSKYEPCGLNQMYSLKYGTVPVVRATGGLDDTIKEFDPSTADGNGFKFDEYSSGNLVAAIENALRIFEEKELWTRLMENAMKEDFSWERSARKYEEVYRKALSRV